MSHKLSDMLGSQGHGEEEMEKTKTNTATGIEIRKRQGESVSDSKMCGLAAWCEVT